MNKITNNEIKEFIRVAQMIKQLNPTTMSGGEKRAIDQLVVPSLDGENEQGQEIVACIILNISARYNRSTHARFHVYIDGVPSNLKGLRNTLNKTL